MCNQRKSRRSRITSLSKSLQSSLKRVKGLEKLLQDLGGSENSTVDSETSGADIEQGEKKQTSVLIPVEKINQQKQESAQEPDRTPKQEQEQEDDGEQQQELEKLIDAIEQEKWPDIANNYSEEELKRLNKKLRSTEDYKGASLLHMALCFEPPISVFTKMAKDLPEALTQQDILGRTPLHLAIDLNSSRLIVGRLLQQCPKASSMRDNEGRTPLHKCCGLKQVDINVVEALVEASPSTLDIEDDWGMCPLEAAIVSGGNYEVVKVIQKAKRFWLIQV